MTRTLQGHLTELRTLLTSTLDEGPFLPWDRFKVPLLAAEFELPQRLAMELPRRGVRLHARAAERPRCADTGPPSLMRPGVIASGCSAPSPFRYPHPDSSVGAVGAKQDTQDA